jgi:hypothetical protein
MREERKRYIWRGLGGAERSPAFSGDNQIMMEYIEHQAKQRQIETEQRKAQ